MQNGNGPSYVSYTTSPSGIPLTNMYKFLSSIVIGAKAINSFLVLSNTSWLFE